MQKQNLDQLTFPNGRSVKRAKQDAKKRAKDQKVSLNQALDRIASDYGNFPTWEKAMKVLQNKGSINDKSAPKVIVIASHFDQWLKNAVTGSGGSVLEGMTQALDPKIRSSLESLHDEGFPEEILADFAHQMSKS